MREQMIHLLSMSQGQDAPRLGAVEKMSISMFIGAEQDPSYTSAIQAAWQANAMAPTKKVSPGNMGDTGVNERYSKSTFSAADRIESGEHQL